MSYEYSANVLGPIARRNRKALFAKEASRIYAELTQVRNQTKIEDTVIGWQKPEKEWLGGKSESRESRIFLSWKPNVLQLR